MSFNVHAGTYQLAHVDARFAQLVSSRFDARKIEQIPDEIDLPITLDRNRLCVIELFVFSLISSLEQMREEFDSRQRRL
jgi:hypothetical protein